MCITVVARPLVNCVFDWHRPNPISYHTVNPADETSLVLRVGGGYSPSHLPGKRTGAAGMPCPLGRAKRSTGDRRARYDRPCPTRAASRRRGRIEDKNEASFIVRDANGQAVAYVYYEEEPGRRSAANLMTRDEARRIAANIVKLPKLEMARWEATRQLSGGDQIKSDPPRRKLGATGASWV